MHVGGDDEGAVQNDELEVVLLHTPPLIAAPIVYWKPACVVEILQNLIFLLE